MEKTAFIFPGQGAQYIGMCKELYDNYKIVKEYLDNANDVLKFNLTDLIFNGDIEELQKTENTQPAILAVSIAILRLLEQMGIKGEASCGLSLGEYSALVYAGYIKFEDALLLVKKRGKLMQEAVPSGKTKMAAIIGLDKNILNNIIKNSSLYGIVEAVNYNCKGQIVISGETIAVEKAVKEALNIKGVRAIYLQVSGPFHSSMLKEAGEKLKEELLKIEYYEGKKEVVANIDATIYSNDKDKIVEKLSKQVYSTVLFEECINKLIKLGYHNFIEIGPSKTLSGFVRKIDKDLNIYNVEDIKTLKKLESYFFYIK